MTSEELAEQVEAFIVEAVTRIEGTGDEQYSEGDTQAFETKEIDAIFQEAREELIDVVNYSVMLAIKFDALQAYLADKIMEVARDTA